MSKEIIGIEYTMKSKGKGVYVLVDNENEQEICRGTEEQVQNLFIEQNERAYNRLVRRTLIESQNKFKADAIIDGGEGVFREIALGKCYYVILKMINNHQITQERGLDFMEALELYAYNKETPLASEEGREYYKKYKEGTFKM